MAFEHIIIRKEQTNQALGYESWTIAEKSTGYARRTGLPSYEEALRVAQRMDHPAPDMLDASY